jgi:hypothetical protein
LYGNQPRKLKLLETLAENRNSVEIDGPFFEFSEVAGSPKRFAKRELCKRTRESIASIGVSTSRPFTASGTTKPSSKWHNVATQKDRIFQNEQRFLNQAAGLSRRNDPVEWVNNRLGWRLKNTPHFLGCCEGSDTCPGILPPINLDLFALEGPLPRPNNTLSLF